MVEKPVVNAVQIYLRRLQQRGLPITFGVVFGSQATGKVHQWSDIDLIVVSPAFDGKMDYSTVVSLRTTAGPIDSRLEPIPCGEIEWREDDSRAIVEIARREGEIIYP